MNKTKFLFLLGLTALALSGCGDGNKSEEIVTTDSVKTEDPKINPVSETFFQVPSPGEMLTFIRMVGGPKNKNISFLNPSSNEKLYTDAKSKAVNFGIFSCDLSYCSIFEIGSEALKYFKTVKTMGDQIGVSTAIQPDVLKRLENNVGSPDSLASISDDVYFSSFERLEDSKQGPTLAMVVAGGWMESIYIATHLVKYKANSPLIERMADQKYTLENLIEFMKKHEDADAGVKSVKSDLESLLAEFEKIKVKDAEAVASKDDKKKMLAGGQQLMMNEETYNAIVAKIKAIRNGYTQTK